MYAHIEHQTSLVNTVKVFSVFPLRDIGSFHCGKYQSSPNSQCLESWVTSTQCCQHRGWPEALCYILAYSESIGVGTNHQ